ncbi:MAG: hypothetical protein ABJH72_24625 [Reichenbachiella sp.]|uniref:hypothetical protein n=1 Tax=Reichenbachiella sp. TaxID=2184521 RepID=UPI0032640735
MKIKEIQDYIPQAQQYYSDVEDYYRSLSFEEAVQNAAQAIIPSGIKSCSTSKTAFASHQRRVGKKKCKEGAEKLLTHPFWSELENAKSFEDIFRVTEKVKAQTERLGDLWSYDTAQRIALHKGWYPNEVYLQSGAKDGAKSLVKEGHVKSLVLKGKRHVKREHFPDILKELKPYLIENILCVGKREGWFINSKL